SVPRLINPTAITRVVFCLAPCSICYFPVDLFNPLPETGVRNIMKETFKFNSGSPDIPGELSEREFQILQLIAEGQMNKEIARSLAISAETVKWHIKNIYAKLKVNSRTQAMSRALEMKLLD
ncbi:response regulator transcription factor, partial [Acinetobacter baumannii]|uniref:response regulator transcription factor n=1 Tax=Acinetobacter baumannii TaxID=470 RepID=UPI002279B4EC